MVSEQLFITCHVFLFNIYDQATLKKDKKLAEFLANPSIKKGLKAEGLAGALTKLQMNAISKNLFTAIAENGR